jgi:hypothetical protein
LMLTQAMHTHSNIILEVKSDAVPF